MRRHHTGSGQRTALSTDWASAMAPIAEQFMLEAVVSLRNPGGTTAFSEVLGRTATIPFPPFALYLAANVIPISASTVSAVDEQTWVLGYRVLLPLSTDPTLLDEGILVDVNTCSDPLLVGKELRVTDVVRGTHQLQRELVTDAART